MELFHICCLGEILVIEWVQIGFDRLSLAHTLSTIADVARAGHPATMLENDLDQLRRVVARRSSAITIDEALAPIATAADPHSIKPLLLLLDDDSDDAGMWSLVHAAERFDDMVYVASFLEALPTLVIASTRWASVLMMRLLNSDTARPELVRQLRIAASDVKRSTVLLCEQINYTDARFLAKTAVVLAAGNG